jgi:hypothetical protein
MTSRSEAVSVAEPTYPPLIRKGVKNPANHMVQTPKGRAFLLERRFFREEANEYLITSPRGQQTIYLHWHEGWTAYRDMSVYKKMVFGDQFDSPEDSRPLAGGEETALAPGKVVLEIGSGLAVALTQYAQKYKQTTFIGIDQFYEYEETRIADLTKHDDIQLIKDDWTTLSTIPTESVDTILSVQSVFPWGIGPIKRPDSEKIADTITRVAKPGAIWRFDINSPLYEDPAPKLWLENLLTSRGWKLTFTYDADNNLKRTVVAEKVPQETIK